MATRFIEGRPAKILLVEDSPDDVELTLEAFRTGTVPVHLSVVSDGIEAMEFLRRQGEFAGAPRPDIILLDLNLPRKDGREVLIDIKSDERLSQIPVIMLTTSQAQEDVLSSYQSHANSYISKPVDLNQFFEIVNGLEEFWLKTALLPEAKTDGQ